MGDDAISRYVFVNRSRPVVPAKYMTSIPVTFESLGLAEPIQRAISAKNYTEPSPIQARAIPYLLDGRDLMGCAQTGTGKTAAFALPILHLLATNKKRAKPHRPRALILTPTRELAGQIAQNFSEYGKHLPLRHTVIYGGVRQGPQVRALKSGADILVATPGRLLDLFQQKQIDLSELEIFVLDEADRMLDMGFVHDVKRILAQLPAQRQSLLFSATMPESITTLAQSFLNDPATVTIAPEAPTADRIRQRICHVDRTNKPKLLLHLLNENEEGLALVFSRTKHGANRLARRLSTDGIRAEAIHGNKSQAARERALNQFRKGAVRVLVATDIAARGIDVKGVSLVVNFDLPNEPEAYVHRIGRTARAGTDGAAFSLCEPEERTYLRNIQRLIRQEITIHDDHPYALEVTPTALAEIRGNGRAPAGQKGRSRGNRRRRFRGSRSNQRRSPSRG
ncbi:MAG TPA: DEAD/DEAH box helicase [Opitutales bacterium]|nr:DEAD/DEAH box helicase [Opitutales bacterium]